MDDLTKISSLATVQDLQRNIRNYTYERKKNYLNEVKANIAELKEQLLQGPEISEREKHLFVNTKKVLNQTKLDMSNCKEALEKSISLDTLKLENMRNQGIEMDSVYRNRLVELRNAMQSYPSAVYIVRLENEIRLNQFNIKKNKLQAENYQQAIKRREEFRWESQKMDTVETARCMVEERKKLGILQEMRRETARLTRERAMESLNVLKCRNEPALPLLQVFVVPENPRVSPPNLTPLMDMLSSEEFNCVQAEYSLEDTGEPPAKSPRCNLPMRSSELSLKHNCLSFITTQNAKLNTSNDEPNKNSPNTFGTSTKAKGTTDATDKNIHSKMLRGINTNANEMLGTCDKQIVVLNEKILCEKEVDKIVQATEIEKLQKVMVIGSAPQVGHSGLLQVYDIQKNKLQNVQVQEAAECEAEESVTADSLLLPPTLFQDPSIMVTQDKPHGSTEVSEHINSQKIRNELDHNTQLSFRPDDLSGDLSMDIDLSHGEFTSLQPSADYNQMKRDLMKKYNVNSSPEFVYAKKNEEKTVTSKFFKKTERPEKMEVESAAVADTTQEQRPETTVWVGEPHTPAVPIIVDNEAAEKIQQTAAAGTEMSLPTTVDSELDDSNYDFTSMLDTPSLLLSPKPDDPPTCETASEQIQPTSLFGGPRSALNLMETLAVGERHAEPDSVAHNNASAFSFNFQDKKKRGFFSLFN